MHHDLAALLLRRRPWHTLEAPFYTDEAVFRADLATVFGRHWIFVGQEPDIPEPGDVLALRVGEAPVLILRDDDGAVRAFHNV
ncbi:MAG: Rieske 2Fe-2S domain-containing protein, partial [Acetobacteraceae bacterium]|nr:Rieske 2Fe-2S domain-containing protein [Acetobacteraceae bacterium]